MSRYDEEPFPPEPDSSCPTCGHARRAHNPFMVTADKMERLTGERTGCSHDCDCPGFPLEEGAGQ